MTRRFTTFGLLLVVSWIVMTFTHESGHLVGGFISGATLTDFDLTPWRMPYSVHAADPHPLITLWSGPLCGIAVPLMFALISRRRWAWFIADFCLVANGIYLALAWVSGDHLLDTSRLLSAGAHPVSIAIYCVVTIGWGYAWFRTDCVHYLSVPKPMKDDESKTAN